MKKARIFFIIGLLSVIAAGAFTFAVSKVDISNSCYENDSRYDNVGQDELTKYENAQCEVIGFSTVNYLVNGVFPFNETLYKLTDIAGYIPIVFALIYGITGIIQLLKRKKLMKVDHELIALGGLFAVAFATYVAFNKFAVNYRPVLLDGELESSFPSSHTMLILCICFGIITSNLMFHKNIGRLKIVNAILTFSAAFIVVGRFLSGAHWATDIFGGLLYAIAYLTFYKASLIIIKNKNEPKEEQ